MSDESPKFIDLNRIEENLLVAKLEAARSAIVHAGEKGRALEHVVTTLLRSFLPAEYGLSTGFIVFHTPEGPELTRQLDVIIYDAVRSSPIISLETCDVLPLEAVYGYVEVKAALRTSKRQEPPSDSIEYCLRKCAELRQMRTRRYFCPLPGMTTGARPVSPTNVLAIRSWVFVFELAGPITKPQTLAKRLADYSASLDPQPHLHGLFVANHGYFRTVPIELSPGAKRTHWEIDFTTTHALSAFKWDLLHGLGRFHRFPQDWTANVARYGPNADYSQVSSRLPTS